MAPSGRPHDAMPMNRIPSPARISPMAFTFLFFKKVTIITPIIASTGAISLAFEQPIVRLWLYQCPDTVDDPIQPAEV